MTDLSIKDMTVSECMHVAEWEDVELRRYVCYWIKQAHIWEASKTDVIPKVSKSSLGKVKSFNSSRSSPSFAIIGWILLKP